MRSLSIASSGMLAQQTNVDVISHNIANMNTTGFKRQRAEFQDLLYQQEIPPGAGGDSARAPSGIQIGAGVKTGSPAAFEGSQYFSAGNVEEGQVQQTVDLLAAGFTATQLDAGDLDMVFGGRTRSAAESPVDRGALTLEAGGVHVGEIVGQNVHLAAHGRLA